MITNKSLRAFMVAVLVTAGGNQAIHAGEQEATYGKDKDKDHAEQTGKKLTTAHFVHKAVWSGLKELRLGEVAQEKALKTEVRDFATRMVMDHQKVNDRLTELARLKGLIVPDTNSLDQPYGYKPAGEAAAAIARDDQAARNVVNAELPPRDGDKDNPIPANADPYQKRFGGELAFDEIRKLSGGEFDRAFMSQMITDHSRAVSLFSKAAQELDDAEIKSFALETLPKLREHLRDAERISTEITRSNF